MLSLLQVAELRIARCPTVTVFDLLFNFDDHNVRLYVSYGAFCALALCLEHETVSPVVNL